MDEKINATVEKIKLLAKQNSEFAKEMQNLFGMKEPSLDLPILTSVSNDVFIPDSLNILSIFMALTATCLIWTGP